MDGVFLSEDLKAEKPGQEFFTQVFHAIGPISKEEVLIVGDSLTSDIRGGNHAGIRTCWYHPEGRDDTMIQEAGVQVDEVITDLHEVYRVLEKL